MFVSCRPDKDESVKTGSANDNLILIEPNPSITIPFYPYGSDSLDLNSDNKFDIKFIRSPRPALTGFATETLISTINLQIVLSKTNDLPEAISSNILLDNNSNWSNSTSAILILQSFKCNSNECPDLGNFINVTDKFLGFKIGDKIGWMKLDNSKNGDLKIKEYTVIK